MKIDFYLRFHTQFGQTLAITGNIPVLGNDVSEKALSLDFLNDEFWHTSIEIDPRDLDSIHYRYVFTTLEGERKKEAERNRVIDLKKEDRDIVLIDTWNDESYFENAFFTAPFTQVFFRNPKKLKIKKSGPY